jgi:biopolymer transport protein ExbB
MGTHVIRRAASTGAALFLTASLLAPPIWAQQTLPSAAGPPAVAPPLAGSPTSTAERIRLANEAAEAQANQMLAAPSATPTGSAPEGAQVPEKSIDLWRLAQDGGPLMYPIYAASVVVMGFAFERAFALRRRKLMPPELVAELGELARRPGGLDPRAVYRVCLRYPSSASTILRAVLLKVGRPYAELETTLKELNEREAARLYKNVRPIELQISIAPLLGLLGTVQGMIMAFFVTANADLHVNKAEQLAQGIYVALVTTFAGLCVAIPAAVFAHHFEGRIQTLFRDLDELILGLLPNFERFEGKLRVNRQTLSGENEHAAEAAPSPPERAPVKVPK